MRIGLVDVDGCGFPNIALMKISYYHKSRGDEVEFINYWDTYDIVYSSKVFTYSEEPMEYIQSDVIIKGGTGYEDYTTVLDYEIEHSFPDYSLYPNHSGIAYGFITRGCSRNCPFCIVNKKEGPSHQVANISEFWNGQKFIQLFDPNLLECSDRLKILEDLAKTKAYIDFNQGVDIRLVDKEIVAHILKLKIKRIHFAYDTLSDVTIENNLTLFKQLTGWKKQKVSVYVLTNYNSTIKEDLERIYFIKTLGFQPYVMVYNKHLLERGSIYNRLQRWVNNPRIFWKVENFKDYCRKEK